MKKKSILFLLFILCVFGFGTLHHFNNPKEFSVNKNIRNDFERYIDAGYFLQSASLGALIDKYNHPEKKVRILLVPGHTTASPGALYKDIQEIDFTFEFAEQLHRDILQEDWATVEIASLRDEDTNNFKHFFEAHSEDVEMFEASQKNVTEELRSRLLLEEAAEGNHVVAARDVAKMLYGVNHYANKNNFDIVLHIHFNDYPRSNKDVAGKYEGYALYVPDALFSNSEVSVAIATAIAEKLSAQYATSTHPLESRGIIESKELIAVGAHNTARVPAILLEYAYIYEPVLQDEETRKQTFKKMSTATIEGVKQALK